MPPLVAGWHGCPQHPSTGTWVCKAQNTTRCRCTSRYDAAQPWQQSFGVKFLAAFCSPGLGHPMPCATRESFSPSSAGILEEEAFGLLYLSLSQAFPLSHSVCVSHRRAAPVLWAAWLRAQLAETPGEGWVSHGEGMPQKSQCEGDNVSTVAISSPPPTVALGRVWGETQLAASFQQRARSCLNLPEPSPRRRR